MILLINMNNYPQLTVRIYTRKDTPMFNSNVMSNYNSSVVSIPENSMIPMSQIQLDYILQTK